MADQLWAIWESLHGVKRGLMQGEKSDNDLSVLRALADIEADLLWIRAEVGDSYRKALEGAGI